MTKSSASSIHLDPIGYLRTGFETLEECPASMMGNDDSSYIELLPRYAAGLHNIELASHVIVLYWLHLSNRKPHLESSGCNGRKRGVFASRTPNRPNPIAMSVTRLIAHDQNILQVAGLDCIDGTAVLDIKPYVPQLDHITDASISWTPPHSSPALNR
ncbi:tRNA (N6-threonylcarbamoyladenosine(37)-N6)-methyltransferase TrmO [Epibacterium sp. MM17-32]|uniref:tRNA (N6-threonylcarbamoyladenosine(37)-N6)-methyltransferase TrmO n=1 Tax=Epibacterium sp. MM17-32 TaxID=2917734 RepID=UPI001EF4FC33|nr:tRNA (N6-threonylcarbamoyladenosine(37)-N6)-methyltransferase TrmO [Epibacterium sp. MM17-32]MCG7630012.1 tRNA (N6-threonylcarbamoyladenosine(37)-N6)-methyltransferase TrmO [Epibacterium sp. MM17-32]